MHKTRKARRGPRAGSSERITTKTRYNKEHRKERSASNEETRLKRYEGRTTKKGRGEKRTGPGGTRVPAGDDKGARQEGKGRCTDKARRKTWTPRAGTGCGEERRKKKKRGERPSSARVRATKGALDGGMPHGEPQAPGARHTANARDQRARTPGSKAGRGGAGRRAGVDSTTGGAQRKDHDGPS